MGPWKRGCGVFGKGGQSSTHGWQSQSHLEVRGVWKDGNCWQHLCVSRFPIWQTWRNNNAALSAGPVPGREGAFGSEHDVWFSQMSRERVITPHIDLHTHLLKNDICMCACTHTHRCTHLLLCQPGTMICISTHQDRRYSTPNRAEA